MYFIKGARYFEAKKVINYELKAHGYGGGEEENEEDDDDDGRVCWWHLNGGEEKKIRES